VPDTLGRSSHIEQNRTGSPDTLTHSRGLPGDIGGTHHITGTAQKVCIVNPRLAIAWSGRMIYARHVITRMKRYFSDRVVNESSIKQFFDRQDAKHMHELEIVGCYRNGEHFNSFGINTTTTHTDDFGTCHIGGTGTGDFVDLIYTRRKFEASNTQKVVAMGIGTALVLASQILFREINSGDNLALYYGGGLEIATLAGGRYQKIGDILHVFWKQNNNEITFLSLLLKKLLQERFSHKKNIFRL
jgi:hypothetical protein